MTGHDYVCFIEPLCFYKSTGLLEQAFPGLGVCVCVCVCVCVVFAGGMPVGRQFCGVKLGRGCCLLSPHPDVLGAGAACRGILWWAVCPTLSDLGLILIH